MEKNQIDICVGRLETPNEIAGDDLNSIGWELHSANKFEEAILKFEEAIKLNPNHALAKNNLGLSLRKLGRFKEAIKWFENSIKTIPECIKGYSNAGETLGLIGDSEKADEYFKKALKIDPYYQKAIQGLELYCKGRISKNEYLEINEELKRVPKGVHFFMLMGFHLVKVGHSEIALTQFKEADKLVPNNEIILELIAGCYNNLYRFSEGENYGLRAIKVNPDYVQAWLTLSLSAQYLPEPDYYKSIEYCENAIKIDPATDMAWNNYGGALMMLGEYGAAIEKFEKCISINPDNPFAKLNRGACRRMISPPPVFTFIGHENLSMAKAAFERSSDKHERLGKGNGPVVCLIFDFTSPRDWKDLIETTNDEKYENLKIIDLVERSEATIEDFISQINSMGGRRIALDLTIRLAQKRRKK